MSQLGTGRWFLGCGSVTLIVCILISHKQHTIKCQSPQSFRPIKPVAHHQQQVNHFKSPSASQLATSFQLQQRHPAGPQLAGSHYHSSSNNQQSVISYQPMVQPVAGLSPWSPNILRGPPKLSALSNNGPSGTRHHRQLSLGQQHQVKHQQAQQQQQQRQQQVPTITNSLLNNAPPRQDAATVQMATERRVSSSQQLVTDNIGPVLPGTGQQSSKINQQPREAVNEQLVPTRLMSSMANQQDQQEQQPHHWHHDQNGKLLICYYATKQTAPYWPKNSREFIVPASRLDEAASEFLKMRSEPPPAGGSQQFFSSPPFAASSSGHNFNRQQQQQQQQQLGSFVQNLPANSLSLQGLNIAQQQQQATPTVSHVGGDGHQRRSIFAGGRRLVVVAPEFVPFNQSKLMMPHNRQQQQQQQQHNEIAVDQPDSLAHMFFMANHNRHNTIADRQDNGATITSAALSTSPTATTTTSNTNTMITNKSNAKLQLGAPTQQQLVEFGGVPNNNEQQLQNQQDTNMMTHNTGGFVVFNNNKSKQDLTNNNDNHQRIINTGGGGGGLGHGSYEAATGGNRLAQSQTSIDHLQLGQSVGQQQQAAGAGISAPISRLPNRNTGANQQNNDRSSAPSSSANVNNRDHPERAAKARHELLLSPSMGRAFMLGSTSTTSSFSSSSLAPDSSSIVVPSSLNYEDKPPPDYRPLFGGSSGGGQPTLNNEQSATSNYYYYYNLPNSNQLSQQTKSGSTTTTNEAGPSSAMMPVTTAIIGNGRPTGLDQQQHHELSGTTLAGFNSHGGGPALQRANSLVQQTPADQNDLLQPAMFTSSSPLPSSSSSSSSSPQPAAASSPTSYLINTPTHQGSHNLALDALIVSNNNNNQAPSSLTSTSTTASTSQRQRYSSSSSTTPNNQQQVNSSPKSDYLFKLSGSSSLAPPASEDIVSPSSMLSIKSTTPSLIVQSSSSSPLGTFSQRPPNSSASSSATGDTAGVSSSGLQSKVDDSSSNNRNQQQQQLHNHHHGQHQHHGGKQTVGLGGNSLSAALVSSPLSTMFDVFGAASQYLMRFKPSSLISPASFAAFNNIGAGVGGSGDHTTNSHGSNKLRENSSSLGSLVSLTSFTGQGGQHHNSHNQKHQSVILGDHKARPSSSPAARANNSSSSHPHAHQVAGGFLSRLSLQQGAQRRDDICGRTIQTPERRIIGGEGAKYGEFPYQVHIKIAKHQCGGALIDRQSIVTAAHCVYHFITRAPVSKLQIVIGAYDIEDEQYQELPPQHFKVNKVKLHPNFRFSASHPDRYDIAILKLDKPVKYTDNVLPVCLPGKDLKYENMVGTVTGFGKTDPSLSNRYGTRLLQKVDVPIIENGECERWHRTRGIDLKIFPEMMCAGYEDGLKDACVGDSGGPLVVKTPIVVKGPDGGDLHSFRWTLAGITSAGFGCAQSRQPGIYHRVSHTVDWILDNLD